MKHMKRLAALVLAAILTLGIVPAQATESGALTRGEAANILLEAGFRYTPGLELTDIVHGHSDGNLDLEGPVTRVQALLMLERAFGGLPATAGDNARSGYPAGTFPDVPAWAREELDGVLAAGIVAGDGGLLVPDRPVTEGELNALICRVYALKGTDVRDDFYAAANKQWLDASAIPAGLSINGPFYGLGLTVNQQIAQLIRDIHAQPQKEGSAEAKADVEEMIREFIAIYKDRIRALDWMGEATKEKAIRKLDAMKIKVGYPDSWDTYLDNARIKSPEEGGTLFSNTISIQMAALEEAVSRQNEPVDKTRWAMQPFTVNTCYSFTANDITFPAAILQSPLYDVNASREENLGGIGYIIAHEITHAPDKLRCNRVLQTLPEFYETYGIRPGDGMWTDPASRASVW